MFIATTEEAAVQAVTDIIDVACQAVTFYSPKLSIRECVNPPNTFYHPAIINASIAFYNKYPSNLTDDEIMKFNFYLQRKQELGAPVE